MKTRLWRVPGGHCCPPVSACPFSPSPPPRSENLGTDIGDSQSTFGNALSGADKAETPPLPPGEKVEEMRRGAIDEGRTYPPPGLSMPQSPALAVAPAAPPGVGVQAPGPCSLTCGGEARVIATTALTPIPLVS